jgi:hypothetical protein
LFTPVRIRTFIFGGAWASSDLAQKTTASAAEQNRHIIEGPPDENKKSTAVAGT